MSNFEVSLPQSKLTDKETTFVTNQASEFAVQFWGVRGLIPTPSSVTSRYGGNTVCVEIRVGGKRLVLDAGTGLRQLGRSLENLTPPVEAHLFFTNPQTNRIQGFPFFVPALIPGNCFHIYGALALNGASIKQCLYSQMLQPHFPFPLQRMQSELIFENIRAGKEIKLDDVTVITGWINKAHKSLGYRVNWQEQSVAYVTDLPANTDEMDLTRIEQLITDADLVIANATYSYPIIHNKYQPVLSHWQTAVDLAHQHNVKQLVISLHHPDCDDEFLDRVEAEMQSVFPTALLAREGMILAIKK
jgi:phosphoribosyl 1,2-cyclic phosphodiesterase